MEVVGLALLTLDLQNYSKLKLFEGCSTPSPADSLLIRSQTVTEIIITFANYITGTLRSNTQLSDNRLRSNKHNVK